ncbi:MAG: hypothetical protein IRY89_05085 [Pseudolabrys sp.]|nr:hypothetical protein [Pseudolabrys sp.]
MSDADPTFEARPNPNSVGHSWCVYVTWPSGKKDIVTGFATQYDALSWIKTGSANWVVEQIMRRQD